MNHLESIILGYLATAGTLAVLGTLGMALLIGFVGALGGFLFKLLLDAIKKRIKRQTNKPFKQS